MPDGPMMINLRKPEILEWHMTELLERGIHRCRSLANLFQ